MEREIKLKVMDGECTDKLTQIQQIWYRFEEWRQLIRSAGQLLGEIIILNHETSFFIICDPYSYIAGDIDHLQPFSSYQRMPKNWLDEVNI